MNTNIRIERRAGHGRTTEMVWENLPIDIMSYELEQGSIITLTATDEAIDNDESCDGQQCYMCQDDPECHYATGDET